MVNDVTASILVSPDDKEPLHLQRLEDLEGQLGVRFVPPRGIGYDPVGRTELVLARHDGAGAYPVVDGNPVLLVPEMLVPEADQREVNVTDPKYAEAYEEMEHYNAVAVSEAAAVQSSKASRDLRPLVGMSHQDRSRFPDPPEVWLDAKYEIRAQYDAFGHLAPLDGARALQIGGRGLHAVRFLLAGAAEAWVVSPMVGELVFATALADVCGVGERLHCVAAVAEELPFATSTFDAVYSQGCVHHWVTALALPECLRVLTEGGRFAAVEPWKGPFYDIGTKVLGKRDRNVRCQVLTADRVLPHLASASDVAVVHHGAITRYPLLALWKMRVKPSRRAVWKIMGWDDAVSDRLTGLRAQGSSVAILSMRLGSVQSATVRSDQAS